MIKSPEEIDAEISNIKDILFIYDTDNLENFSSQISSINNIDEIYGITTNNENITSRIKEALQLLGDN